MLYYLSVSDFHNLSLKKLKEGEYRSVSISQPLPLPETIVLHPNIERHTIKY